MNGVVTVTSFDTDKVLHFEYFSKFCTVCMQKMNMKNEENLQHKNSGLCSVNNVGDRIEVTGAKTLCVRSEEKLGLCYYLGASKDCL